MFHIVDDGTLDTVVRCDDCGGEERFNIEGFDDDEDRIDAALFMADEDHECYEDGDDP